MPSSQVIVVTKTMQSLVTWSQSRDWGFVVMVAAFLGIVTIAVAPRPTASAFAWISGSASDGPFAAYDEALAAAAIKRPEYQRPLETIDTPKVEVVNFGWPLESASKRDRETWVALKTQLQDRCAGADDPVLRLQEVLGLPPGASPGRVINELSVDASGLFRPCASGGDITAASCGPDFPKLTQEDAPDTSESPEAFNKLLAEYKKVLDSRNQLYFLASQMWSSYKIGFPRTVASSSDYPYSGYPFTGMGWSYDWASSSPDHVGVSEFVIKRDAAITVVATKTPAEFCASNSASDQPSE